MNLDEFLGHKTNDRDSKYLNWRKRKPSQLNCLLHRRAPIVALWRHGFPRIVEIEEKGEKVKQVWGGNFNCWEPEAVLRTQYRRHDDGTRKLAPTVCPMCILIEWLRGEVRAGRLSWTDELFVFEGEKDSQVINVGGIYNAFGDEDLTRQQREEMRKAGIRGDQAWKQNGMAKCAYVLTVVDADDPKAVHVVTETSSLGDKLKTVIGDQIESLGATEGNPLLTPYGFRWSYRESATSFNDKYHVLALPKLEVTPEIAEQINSEPPDISRLIARGNARALRSVMESVAKIDLPFDRIFGPALALEQEAPRQASREDYGADDDAPPSSSRTTKAVPAAVAPPASPPAAAPARRRAAPKKPDYPPGTVIVPCEHCKAETADTDTKCWNCGAEFELEPEAPPAEKKATDGQPDVGF